MITESELIHRAWLAWVPTTLAGDDLRSKRKRLRLTQAKLAQRLRVSINAIIDWESSDPPGFVTLAMTWIEEHPDAPSPAPIDRAELRKRREHLKLGTDSLGEALMVTGRTVRRWEAGNTKVPGPIAHAMAWLDEHPEYFNLFRPQSRRSRYWRREPKPNGARKAR